MQIISKHSLLRSIKVLVLTFLILVLVFSSPNTAAANRLEQKSGLWGVSISGLDSAACAGDPYMFTVRWWVAGKDDLAPITGPDSIIVTAKLGKFDEQEITPISANGTALSLHTAGKEGYETITIVAYDSNWKTQARYTTSFEIKKCDYFYTLFARSDYSIPDPGITWYSILKSKGRLVAPDPSRPTYRESYNSTITEENFVTSFPNSECDVDWMNPGYALGFVDSKLVEADNGMGLKLMIGQPIDFDWIYQVIIQCPENPPHNITGSASLTTDKDPWIEQVFPFGEGKFNIKIDILDKQLKNAASGGIVASYTATISLERRDGK